MAEAGPSANNTYLRTRRGNRGARKPQYKSKENTEDVVSPKIIIRKRPPRMPKLPNGTIAPRVSFRQVIESSESILQNAEGYAVQGSNAISQVVHIEQLIGEAEDQFSQLQLSQDLDNGESTVPTSPEKSINGNPRKRTRRPRKHKRNLNSEESCENVESNDIEVTEQSTSTYNQKKELAKKKETEKNFEKRVRNHLHKSQQKAFRENNVKKNNERAEQIAKERKAVKENKKREKRVFCEHLTTEVVKRLLAVQNSDKPNVIEGNIRINPRCYQNAYVSLITGEQDILIVGLKDRNRALEGDLVAVVLNHPDKWFKLNENSFQKTGSVVSILEKVHPRKAIGFLKKQDVFVFLKPRDCRVPLMKINPKTVPRNFYDNPDLYKETLFLCNIIDWKKVDFAEGEILEMVGVKGDLTAETNAILLENDLFLSPYDAELLEDLPPPDYIPTELDLADREDLRSTCIFTIDPATAVDLDDAMSCKPLENGNFEIGIHIADVTHFLKAFSPLDREVAERATTVYMVDNVYHMLPKQLCLACSLLPGQDKLAFSVILELTATGEIVNYRFAKTVINSCCQMAYEQAQIMIDDESYNWEEDGSLKIIGNYKPSDLCVVVRNLYNISTQLRKKRFDDGALRIDQPKLCVFLDKETRLPISYKLEERIESNSLIEEFMLLANMTVGKHLYETLPEVSLLRSHAEPSMRILSKTRDLLSKFDVLLDVDSAGSLHNSLTMLQPNEEGSEVDVTAHYRMMVINTLCAKSMTRAVYKCSASVKSKDGLKHYALNAEFYTHFTSPIRRYPDCVVHRLLYASIKNEPLPEEWDKQLCTKVAMNCNTKKYSAKMAQEQSNALYFTYMLDLQGSMKTIAIVMDVKKQSADAMLCDTGLKLRLYFSDTIEETTSEFTMDHDVPTVKLTWKERQIVQVINIFSILHVKITKHPQLFRLQGIILPPVNIDVQSGCMPLTAVQNSGKDCTTEAIEAAKDSDSNSDSNSDSDSDSSSSSSSSSDDS